MVEGVRPDVRPPEQWSSFRRGQSAGAFVFVPLALLGAWWTVEGHLPSGLAMLVGFGLFGVLGVLNAHTGRRGVDAVRVETRDGRSALVFPAHRVGTISTLAMVGVLVVGPLAGVAYLVVQAVRGSTGAGVGAALLVVVTLGTARPGWIGPTVIDADLGAVAAAVLYYEMPPERRVELQSEAAVRRVCSGGLLPPWSLGA